MNIDDLKFGELKQIASMFSGNFSEKTEGLNEQIGEYVIVRTYSAGVWFGILAQKSGNEVILTEARRMYQWWCKKSISLSGVAKYGINQDKSKICPALDKVWLEAIEILSLTDEAIDSIRDAYDVEAE